MDQDESSSSNKMLLDCPNTALKVIMIGGFVVSQCDHHI